MSLTILSSDTAHHRYFLQKIHKLHRIDNLILETESHKPNFDISSPFEKIEDDFEVENFFGETPNNLPDSNIYSYSNINCDAAYEKLKEIKPKIGIVFGTGKLNKNIIDCFSYCLMNVHRGIPEHYRGLDSDLWAIEDSNYDCIGATLHLVETELDTGGILGQEYLKITPNMKIHHIRFYTTLLATQLSIKILNNFDKGIYNPVCQKSKGKYYSHMSSDKKIEITEKFNLYCSKL